MNAPIRRDPTLALFATLMSMDHDPAIAPFAAVAAHHGETWVPSDAPKFGANALRVNGKIYAALTRSRRLLLKLPPARVTELLATRRVERFESGGRVMNGWVMRRRRNPTQEETPMNFSIVIHDTAEAFARREDPAQRLALFAPLGAYLKALSDAGVFVGGAGLEAPATATVLSQSGNAWQVQDGPFADTKEQLAGLIIIDVPDRASALEWVRRFPMLPGRKLELRANLSPPQE